MKLDDKVAIITGGSKGIGLACAKRLTEGGADVFLIASNAARLAAAATEIKGATGRKVGFAAVDLRTLAGCEEAHARASETFPRCDILINSAGVLPFHRISLHLHQ